MKATGIFRPVDELGRIVIPVELRRTLNIEPKDELEIYVDGSSIVLRKHELSCVFCNSTDELIGFEGKCICNTCKSKFSK